MSEEIDNSQEESDNNELFEHHRIKTDPGQEQLRIDKFLMDRLPNTTRTKIQDAAKNRLLTGTRPTKAFSPGLRPGDGVGVMP